MSNENIKDFLIARIKHFLEYGVQRTNGPYSSANNQCEHGNYGNQGCQACVEAYFTEVMRYVDNLENERLFWKGK